MSALGQADVDLVLEHYGHHYFDVPIQPNVATPLLSEPALPNLLFGRLTDADASRRRSVVLALGRVAHTTRSREAIEALVAHAAGESDTQIAGIALGTLARRSFPTTVRLREAIAPLAAEPLVTLARHRQWQVSHPALNALWFCRPEDAEAPLLEAAAGDEWDARQAAALLAHAGTPRAKAALESLFEHPVGEVRASALWGLERIIGANVLPYARCAVASWRSTKWAALSLLCRHGDADDAPLVAKRVKAIVARERKMESAPSELRVPVRFLLRHRDHAAAQSALATLRRRADRLFDAERAWLSAQVPGFEDLAEPSPQPPPALAAALASFDTAGATLRSLARHLQGAGVEAAVYEVPPPLGATQDFYDREELTDRAVRVEAMFIELDPSGRPQLQPLHDFEARRGSQRFVEGDPRFNDPLQRVT